MAEARDSPARSFMPKLSRGDEGPGELGKWLKTNGPALLMLTFVFLLALFVRSYFAYETSADNDYIVSGGSDSYYWRRIIDYHAETGLNLFRDPLLNYPDNLINPRPPFFSMSVAVPAVLVEGLFESMDDSVGFFLVWSTAFWGALTVIPVYFLGKETFGRRIGMAAALFFAIMPSHVQRSVLSNADHDALILFLIVTIFYFLLKAIRVQDHRKWVESWKSRSSVSAGLRAYFGGSRKAVLYALMAGIAYAALMMTWVGFAYVTVIILLYYIIQLFVNMFRYQDSMSVTLLILVMMGFGYLIAFPYYANYSAWFGGAASFFGDRFLVPVLLSAGGLFFGMMFVVSRDYPWTVSLPTIVGISAAIVGTLTIFYPWLGEAIMTGQGYFSQSKLYTTIAEAKAPQFSELALSFGMVTFFLSLTGLLYALMRIPKRTGAEYIFIVVWLAASIFMAISAGRFMFNAAPAFAIAAAWVFVVIVDKLDFDSVRRSMAGASGSVLTIMRKSIKVRHVVGVLFLAFMILLPNVWYSVDAGIPSETKKEYDKDIYFSMPSFMRPGGYDETNGSNWYLGAFGYSLPLPSYYFPAAWDWFAEQDSDVYPVSSRPAYVAWWDYGFEAVAEGDHPTVADNFQNGYQFTGNVIMAQSEEEVVALFALRLVQAAMTSGGSEEDVVVSMMEKYGVDTGRMYEILEGASQPIIDEVLSDPDMYGPMSSDLTAANARLVAGRVQLQAIGIDSLVGLYDDLCSVTGWEIRYFNVDSRMFPISAYETGIFYAPAKLSDRRLDGSMPIDFYTITAVDSSGISHALDEITADMVIVSYEIEYEEMFYDSMFYRAMCGFSGSDVGKTDDGLPGYSGSVQSSSPMPGWNMTHFRVVYRTAYYNPYDDYASNPKAWRAVSYDEAMELSTQIGAGEATGVVDYGAGTLYQSGLVFLKYYHGAYVNGTVTTEEGFPVEGLWVTVKDEYGIPHQQVTTDAEGRYSLLAPFGNVTLVVSEGTALNTGLTGSNTISSVEFDVTDEQAMRVQQDLDGDGVYDYILTKDFVMSDSSVYGDVFWDNDKEGNFTTDSDELMTDVMVYAVDTTSGMTYEFEAPEGSYDGYLPPGQYELYALVMGANVTIALAANVSVSKKVNMDLAIQPGSLAGFLLHPDGSPAVGYELVMDDLLSDAQFTAVTFEDGSYLFKQLLPSKYQMTTTEEGKTLFEERFGIESTVNDDRNVTVWDSCTVKVRVMMGGVSVAYSPFVITDDYSTSEVVSGITDKYGWIDLALPPGEYTLHAVYSTGTASFAGLMSLDLRTASSFTGVLPVYEAFRITGGMVGPSNQVLKTEYLAFVSQSGARARAVTDSLGSFDVLLPAGEYDIVVSSVQGTGVYASPITLTEDRIGMVVKLTEAVKVTGTLYLDADGDLEPALDELGRYTGISLTDSDGNVYKTATNYDGSYILIVPKAETVALSVSSAGHDGWSEDVLYDTTFTGTTITAPADDVRIEGLLTSDGVGVAGVTISFIPDDSGLQTVEAVSGSGGSYSALVTPSSYTVVVDQELVTSPGTWFKYESSAVVSPRGDELTMDIEVPLRVNVQGVLLGAAQDMKIEFSGPEGLSVELDSLSYSVFLIPGTYSVYGTGWIGSIPYASIDSISVSSDDAEHDFELERAYEVRGLITVGGDAVTDYVSVVATSSTGMQAAALSSRTGDYSLALPKGTYALSFLLEDFKVVDTYARYLEHWGEFIVIVGSDDVSLDPDLATRYDNSTFSGTVVDERGASITANVELVPLDKYGMYVSFATTSSGSFSAQVQPGEYTVYVTRSVDTRVSVSSLTVNWDEPASADIQLSVGQYLEGRLTVGGSPSTETVSVYTPDTKLTVTPSGDGYFQFILPSGDYTVSSNAVRSEGGMTVDYAKSQQVSLGTDSVYVDLSLIRADERSVDGSWNDSRTATLALGQSTKYVVYLENTGNVADTYTLTYSGTDFDVSFSPSEVSMDFGTNGNTSYVIVDVTVGETAEAGNNTIAVTVKSDTLSSARTTVELKVDVLPRGGVTVEDLGTAVAVSSNATTVKFNVNNTGNAPDEFEVSVSNLDALAASGWSATIVDPTTGATVTEVSLGAFQTKELAVRFAATGPLYDPKAEAVVLASSVGNESVSSYGAVSVMLPDLVIGPGGLTADRDDVTYDYDMGRVYLDIGLAVSLASLVAMFFVLRKRKGLGGGGKR